MTPEPTLTPSQPGGTDLFVRPDDANGSSFSPEAKDLLEFLARSSTQTRAPGQPAVHGRAVLTRGGFRPARAGTPPPQPGILARDLTAALERVAVAPWSVRREVASGLSGLPAPTALATADWLVRNDSEWRVREAAAESLGAFSDPHSSQTLAHVAQTDPHPCPAEKAVLALRRLANAYAEEAQREPTSQPPVGTSRHEAVPTRGSAVRCRGAAPAAPTQDHEGNRSDEARSILAMLDELSLRHPDRSVRLAAERTLP